MTSSCPFCQPDAESIIFENDVVVAIRDAFPVSPGHALIIPRRHIESWFDTSDEERREIFSVVDIVSGDIEKTLHPDGFNIGINIDEAAGQTVMHLHVHVIPRYTGDVSNPQGGVRYVIPDRANYLVQESPSAEYLVQSQYPSKLVRGGKDPLLPNLIKNIDQATGVDIAVAFTMRSGVQLIIAYLQDLLDRGGRCRFLTGDYHCITDPQALLQLLDLTGDIEQRVFETRRTSFHLKTYIFHFSDGSGIAYVGSSNLSKQALQHGIEWNYKVITSFDRSGYREIVSAYDDLFEHQATRRIDNKWIEEYSRRRPPQLIQPTEVEVESPEPPPQPHSVQVEALNALEETRNKGNSAGLVVLATGLGKTWLSAFDSNNPEKYERILFVAHREEILSQAMSTFRRIRPDAFLGRYTGTEKLPNAEVLFASIQTLGKVRHLRQFPPDTFDYIVVDEFHHAAARTYRNLIDHFQPKFLLGLTATPERTDGGNLLSLCQENLVFRFDALEGIRRELLCPFKYFGIPDEVNYQNIPWRSSRFDEEELTKAVATQSRAQNVLDQYRRFNGRSTLAFCCSQRHADFMADYFQNVGIKAVSVHSGASSAPRTASLEQLEAGKIDVIFAVDMFNEGVDLPHVDTVMMLRPTESSILWLQQFGRGLRKADGKSHLTVIDYIGNHRIFLTKPRTLLGAGPGDRAIEHALKALQGGEMELPPGCEITYELEAVNIIKSLLRIPKQSEALQAYYADFLERYGERPTASQVFHEGYNPRQTGHNSWIRFIQAMGDLNSEQQEVLEHFIEFIEVLESTPMTKSYKMLVLLALLNEDVIPGEIGIDVLAQIFAQRAKRSEILIDDVGSALNDPEKLKKLIIENPINAWIGGKGTKGDKYFKFDDNILKTTFTVPETLRSAFQEFVREIVDWRLAEYLLRPNVADIQNDQIVFKVISSNGVIVLQFPERKDQDGIPVGLTEVIIDDSIYFAEFGEENIGVVNEEESGANILPQLLRRWFGPDVGLPGTNFQVVLKPEGEQWCLEPHNRPASRTKKELWRQYSREEIPPLFDMEFKTGKWNQGFVIEGNHIFLLVTLEKEDLAQDHQYQDRFWSSDRFQWQSQNRTTQASKVGQSIQNHVKEGKQVHLFVRSSKKLNQRAAPFVYCGSIEFVSWEGEKPITVEWKLPDPVSQRLHSLFKI